MPAVPFNDFPGLDFRQPLDSPSPPDLLNVTFDVPGTVRTRDGYTKYTSIAASGVYTRLFGFTGSSRYIIASTGTDVQALSSGGSVATSTASGTIGGLVMYGTPSSTLAYLANTSTLKTFDGSAFASPTATVDGVAAQAMPIASDVASTPWDNRLVAVGGTGPGGATGSAHHVWFSEAGDATTWLTTNYVQLTPGDGESIVGAVSWGNQLFVFKRTKFFVFYSTSTDGAGNPIFNYRTVDARVGPWDTAAVTTGPDGVYFNTTQGVYHTTGGPPRRLTAPLQALYEGKEPDQWQGGVPTNGRGLVVWNDRLVLNGGTTGTCFVWDRLADRWTYWSLPDMDGDYLLAFSFSNGGKDDLYFSYRSSSTKDIGKMTGSATDDAGTAITSRYRTGYVDMGSPEEKTLRRFRVWGIGTPTFKLSKDFGSLGTGQTLTLGTRPALDEDRVSANVNNGTVYSWEFSSSTGQWTIHRVSCDLANFREPGAKAS